MCYHVIDGSEDGEVVERRVCHSKLLDQQQQLAPLVCSGCTQQRWPIVMPRA